MLHFLRPMRHKCISPPLITALFITSSCCCCWCYSPAGRSTGSPGSPGAKGLGQGRWCWRKQESACCYCPYSTALLSWPVLHPPLPRGTRWCRRPKQSQAMIAGTAMRMIVARPLSAGPTSVKGTLLSSTHLRTHCSSSSPEVQHCSFAPNPKMQQLLNHQSSVASATIHWEILG